MTLPVIHDRYRRGRYPVVAQLLPIGPPPKCEAVWAVTCNGYTRCFTCEEWIEHSVTWIKEVT